MKTRPKKYNYESKKFLDLLSSLAGKGWSDKDIALDLGLSVQHFSDIKNEKDSETGKLTKQAEGISLALQRAREKLNLIARDVYFKTAIGQKKVKEVKKTYAQMKCECGGSMDCPYCQGKGFIVSEKKSLVEEYEKELPPNAQALSVWLFNHDEEWKKGIIESKRLDVTTNGKDVGRELVFLSAENLTQKQIDKYLDNDRKPGTDNEGL